MLSEIEAALNRVTDGARPADVESETLDFKDDGPTAKATMALMADAAACFANADDRSAVVTGESDRREFRGSFYNPVFQGL